MHRSATVALAALVVTSACGGGGTAAAPPDAPVEPRKTVVWLDERGLDEITSAELARVGVDEVLVRRAVVDLAGEAPAVRFQPKPRLEGSLAVGFLLQVEGARGGLSDDAADAVWRAVMSQEGGAVPAEVVLDLAATPEGTAAFVERFAAAAGVPVVALLSVDQLRSAEAVAVAVAAGRCLVPGYGTRSGALRGVDRRGTLPLARDLEPLAGTGVRVRIGIDLTPDVRPGLGRWGEDLDPLTEPANAEIRTASELDRTFVVRRGLSWSGRQWSPGEAIAVRWWDVSRLHANLAEIDRVVLPDIVGWDLVTLPPPGDRLGIGEEALIGYLAGRGPAPAVRVEVTRRADTVRATLINDSPFATAVSGVGNWLELAASQGAVVVGDRGGFDAIELGSRRSGEWRSQTGVADAVRFLENYLAPREELTTGTVRLAVARSEVRVRWHLLLSSGQQVSGALVR